MPTQSSTLLWRACRGSLAINAVRVHRHIASSPLCPHCEGAVESICHALVECSYVSPVWNHHPGGSLIADAPRTSFKDMFMWLLEHASPEVLSSLTISFWAIWTARNHKVFEGNSPNLPDLVAKFAKLVSEYNGYAARVLTGPSPRAHPSPNRWLPPDVNWIKINFDANIVQNEERGLGIVARDSEGKLILAGVKRMKASWSPELSELNVAVYGIEVAIHMGYSHIVLEGDCAFVIKGIQDDSSGFASPYVLFDYIAAQKLVFDDFRCNLVRRNCNTAAHLVARWNSGRLGETIFMYPFPQSLVTLASIDVI